MVVRSDILGRILLASVVAGGMAFAQGGRGGGGGMGDESGGRGGDMSPALRVQRQTKAEIVADKLHLNKEQKEQFAAILSAGQEEMRPISQQLMQGRNVITTALIQGQGQAEISKLMAQFTDLEAQRAAVEAKAYAKLYAILEPKQQAKAGAIFTSEMDGLFDARAGRGARSGRGEGGRQ